MNRILIAAALFFGTFTGYAQKPAKAGATPPPAPAAKPADAPPPASGVSPATVKELKDALSVLQLDQLAIQTAKSNFANTDPVAKKAMDILNQAIATSPEVKKVTDQEEADRLALLAKIDALRKAQTPPLDTTWDWDFNQGKFVKGSQPAPAAPAAPAPAPAKK